MRLAARRPDDVSAVSVLTTAVLVACLVWLGSCVPLDLIQVSTGWNPLVRINKLMRLWSLAWHTQHLANVSTNLHVRNRMRVARLIIMWVLTPHLFACFRILLTRTPFDSAVRVARAERHSTARRTRAWRRACERGEADATRTHHAVSPCPSEMPSPSEMSSCDVDAVFPRAPSSVCHLPRALTRPPPPFLGCLLAIAGLGDRVVAARAMGRAV